MSENQTACNGEEYGYAVIECENPATTSVKVDGEKVALCDDCYEGADALRTEMWEGAYRNR